MFLAILETGCAEFHVVANGFQNRDQQRPAQATYAILPVKGQDSDLEFQDYDARMVEMKLSERGYRRGDLNSAGMAISSRTVLALLECETTSIASLCMAQIHFQGVALAAEE